VGRVRDWLNAKEAELSGKTKTAVEGGKVLAVINTTIFLGPMVAALLMLMLGVGKNKVYLYSIFCALLCAVVWAGLYSGIFWGIGKIVAK
jgi:hypothetical protein